MKRLRDISVSTKLTIIIVTSTTLALVLLAAAFIANDYRDSREDVLVDLATVGRIVAGNSTAALAFNDTNTASELISTLKDQPEIEIGCTYDANRHLLAQYRRHSSERCPSFLISSSGSSFVDHRAAHTQPVLLHDAAVGYVYLEANLYAMRLRRQHFLQITAVAVIGSLIAGLLMGILLRRWIAAPIRHLVDVMHSVSHDCDYTHRATSHGEDEIGLLVNGFNQMLEQIQDSQSQLEYRALNDELTGLPNRRLFSDRLQQALALAAREQTSVGVLYLDLDGFKLVNDTLGHPVGDRLLREVTNRLRKRVRASDTLARIGGDEFMLIAGSLHHSSEAELIAHDLLAQLAEPFELDGETLALTASIGISLYPENDLDPQALVQQSDTAMYAAKAAGKNRITFYRAEFGKAVREQLQLQNELRGAIERNELAVHFQPEFDIRTHRLVRFEALARWKHPTLGMIPPVKFIPVAEQSGLIVPMGFWILENACAAAVRWPVLGHGAVQVGVNVSTVQFCHPDFVKGVVAILHRTGLDPGSLQLELTESVVLPDRDRAEEIMAELRSMGISMAIDDFGTGYSSLSYLPRMTFDTLKIDRTFLKQIMSSPDSRGLMDSLVTLAQSLKMRVIIEGVESEDQLLLARNAGCDEVQGYLFGKPTADPRIFFLQAMEREAQQHVGASSM